MKKKSMLSLRLMETDYGDRYLVRNGYKSANPVLGWMFGGWETIPKRCHVSDARVSSDKTIWSCEMPVEVWEAIEARAASARGGRARTHAKAQAARLNGRKGGRPRTRN